LRIAPGRADSKRLFKSKSMKYYTLFLGSLRFCGVETKWLFRNLFPNLSFVIHEESLICLFGPQEIPRVSRMTN
jgi:hypothetical protein